MTDPYDRAAWPAPQDNPLIQLLQSEQTWFSNEQIVTALGLAEKRALLSNGTVFGRQLDERDTAIESRSWVVPGKKVSRSHGGSLRLFNRRALILAGMRTNTVNAAAFRDWLASRVAADGNQV